QPPRSTLFPYTTLFRSSPLPTTETSTLAGAAVPGASPRILAITTFVLLRRVTRIGSSVPDGVARVKGGAVGACPGAGRRRGAFRSEEHTSELQSRENLV